MKYETMKCAKYQNGQAHSPKWTGAFANIGRRIRKNGQAYSSKLTGTFAKIDRRIRQNGQAHSLK
jgi:hypothetical protein